MTSRKTFFVMLGIILLLGITAILVLVSGSIVLRRQSQRLVELKLDKRLSTEQESSLIQAKKDIAQYSELEQIAESVVPQDKDQAKAIREIVSIADAVGIKLKSISFSTSNLGAAPTSTPATNQDQSGEGGDAATPAPPPPISQAAPVDGAPGVYSLEISIVPDAATRPVTYYQFLDFLERIENNRRTAQVTRVKIDPVTSDSANPYVTFTLTINIFIKP